MSRAIEKNVTP